MMTDEASYRQWLTRNNISRPHPSGRWRIRWSDIPICGGLAGHRFAVGIFVAKNPTEEEYNFFYKWRDSDERKHKLNLVTFLKTAFAARHKIDEGCGIAREMAALVRQALVAFAEGRESDGIQANQAAWCQYMIVREMSHRPLVDKGLSKQRQEETLKNVRQSGTDSNKKKSDQRHIDFGSAMNGYIDNHPNALVLGVNGLLNFLKDRSLTFGYKDSSIEQFAKPLFAAKRKALKKSNA